MEIGDIYMDQNKSIKVLAKLNEGINLPSLPSKLKTPEKSFIWAITPISHWDLAAQFIGAIPQLN